MKPHPAASVYRVQSYTEASGIGPTHINADHIARIDPTKTRKVKPIEPQSNKRHKLKQAIKARLDGGFCSIFRR